MQNLLDKFSALKTWRSPQPSFMKERVIQIAVATSGYCQARCQTCIWPYMEKTGHVMTSAEFDLLLRRFEGYRFSEFAFNVINEPFVDKNIIAKTDRLISSGLEISSLFFSSNWLLPSDEQINLFADVVTRGVKAPHVGSVSLNATISGIDDTSYDELQAGSKLVNAKMPYRRLNFRRAVNTVCTMISALEARGSFNPKLTFNLKAYGHLFDEAEYSEFWSKELAMAGINTALVGRNIRILLNHGFTTFARQTASDDTPRRGFCRTRWLDTRLVIGPNGDIGLCCEDGLRSVVVGNILAQSLDELVQSDSFQKHFATADGRRNVPSGHPCQRCQFFNVTN